MTERLDALDICLIYDVPPWLVSSDYPRCLRNRVLWQLVRVLHRLHCWLLNRR